MKHPTLIPALLILSALPLWRIVQAQETPLSESGFPLHTSTAAASSADEWALPRTEFGQPDFQGTWHFGSRTPMQRPAALGTQQAYTQDEVARREAGMRAGLVELAADLDPARGAPEAGAVIRQEADDNFLAHYLDPVIVPVDGEHRTSVIIDPPNGRVPLRPDFKDYFAQQRALGLTETDGPEGQPLNGRCIMFGGAVPSLSPIMMNANMIIVQTKDYVVITVEMIHDARIIPLKESSSNNDVPRWMGESVGHWDGDTLVVRTKNFRPEQSHPMFMPMSDVFELEEKYTLTGQDTLRYEFTAIDEKAFSQPVTGVRTITRNAPEEQVYEFACHEGNYSLAAILRGARRQEVEAELIKANEGLEESELVPMNPQEHMNHHEGHHDEIERLY